MLRSLVGSEMCIRDRGVSVTIVDARFAKPLDQELILKCARQHEVMITIEE